MYRRLYEMMEVTATCVTALLNILCLWWPLTDFYYSSPQTPHPLLRQSRLHLTIMHVSLSLMPVLNTSLLYSQMFSFTECSICLLGEERLFIYL
jgi:hypothetical protein